MNTISRLVCIPKHSEVCHLGARAWVVALLVFTGTYVMADPTVVNCDQGQSLNRTLSGMNRNVSATVLVKGTCTEYVRISGFQGLTVRGAQGATLRQPSTDPTSVLAIHVLLIEASRSVTVDGLTIHSRSSALGSIGIGRSSVDVRLRNLTLDGVGIFGVIVFDSSQVSLARVTARDAGYAMVGVYDVSDVHIESSLFENSTGAPWHVGFDVGSGHVSVQATTIRNMQIGINVRASGSVDIQTFNTYYPLPANSDVVIENPAATSFWGAWVGSGSSLNVGAAKLRIVNPGQPWGGFTGGVLVTERSTLYGTANLVVSGSQGQGMLVSNNSHATLAGSSITGALHGGLVATNLSTISAATDAPVTQITGNGTDLFCDSTSLISGGSNIGSATAVHCNNLLLGGSVDLP